MEGITIKRFERPDKTVEFVKGRLHVVEQLHFIRTEGQINERLAPSPLDHEATP